MHVPALSVGSREPYRRLAALDVLLLLAIAAVFGALAWKTSSGRRVLAVPTVVRCSSPEETLLVWRRAGVRGRVLVHFARSIAMSSEEGPLSSRDYLLHALQENVIRRVVHVIPDDAWPEVRTTLSASPDAARLGDTFRLQKAGAPILVVRRSDLPRIEEPVLVTIEGDRWSGEALGDIAALLRGPLRSDLVAWFAGDPDRVKILEESFPATP